ncbi:hypothetical protein LCGC14_2803800, partial [marine sediment metagenome]
WVIYMEISDIFVAIHHEKEGCRPGWDPICSLIKRMTVCRKDGLRAQRALIRPGRGIFGFGDNSLVQTQDF